jgi:ABC-2 type transport system permease protein
MILLFIPVFFLLLYGYALNFDIRHIALAVSDRDRTSESREIVSAFVNSGYFDLAATPAGPAEIDRLMNRDQIRAALVIPEGVGRALRSGRNAPVQVLVNGDNANTATVVIGYATAILRSASAKLLVEGGHVQATPMLSSEPRVWFNPELRSTLFLVPGLIAYIAMITAVVSTALSVVREHERGTIEQVRMAPIGAGAFIVGKTIPYFAISLLSSIFIVLASIALFALPMRGDWWLLLLAMSLFLVGALATGLFISTVADSQQMAFQLALVVAFLPTLILSDFIFPIDNMPPAVRAVTYLVPARYFLVALRGILLKDVGLQVLWVSLLALVVYALAMTTLASVRLARRH